MYFPWKRNNLRRKIESTDFLFKLFSFIKKMKESISQFEMIANSFLMVEVQL